MQRSSLRTGWQREGVAVASAGTSARLRCAARLGAAKSGQLKPTPQLALHASGGGSGVCSRLGRWLATARPPALAGAGNSREAGGDPSCGQAVGALV